MGEAIGQLLPFAAVVALSPIPIITVVLLLSTPRARTVGPAFLVGWTGGIAVVGLLLLALATSVDPSDGGEPADWVNWLKLVLGIALAVVGVRYWRGRPGAGDEVETPGWMAALDGFTPLKAAGAAVFLSLANPKNLLLILGAVATEAQFGLATGEAIAVWIVFTLVASIGAAGPVIVYFAMGTRAPEILERLKTWMTRHNKAVMAVVCLIIGVKLVGDAISGLSST
jgi:threonine/homoserine/homoserine lactone efflux protein